MSASPGHYFLLGISLEMAPSTLPWGVEILGLHAKDFAMLTSINSYSRDRRSLLALLLVWGESWSRELAAGSEYTDQDFISGKAVGKRVWEVGWDVAYISSREGLGTWGEWRWISWMIALKWADESISGTGCSAERGRRSIGCLESRTFCPCRQKVQGLK